jgi:four helix bundle protein
MQPGRTHRDLIVWRKSVALASRIYAATNRFPDADRHALAIRMCQTAVSVASNIAEGAASGNRAEYLRFLGISRGCLSELETHVCIGLDLNLIDPADALPERIAEVRTLLAGLGRTLREHRERSLAFTQRPA